MINRRKHSREFKMDAVTLVTQRRVSISQVAKHVGVHASVLHRWVREFQEAFTDVARQKAQDVELARLREEVAVLKMERDFLKKAAAYFAKELA